MKVLIAGGAGYIGSTVASACSDAGIETVVLDSLVTGRREFVTDRPFYEGDIADGPLVDRIFAEHPDIDAVVHCAALIVVPDSVADPVGYYRANVAKSLDFVEHLLRNGCSRMVFSSVRRHLRRRAGPHRDRGLRPRPAEPVRPDEGRVRGDVRGHRRHPADPRAVPALLQPDRRRPADAHRPPAAPPQPRAGQDDRGVRGEDPFPSRAPTSRPATAPASATTSASGTSPPPTWPRPSGSTRSWSGAAWRSTSAPAPARPSASCWTPSTAWPTSPWPPSRRSAARGRRRRLHPQRPRPHTPRLGAPPLRRPGHPALPGMGEDPREGPRRVARRARRVRARVPRPQGCAHVTDPTPRAAP